MKLLRHLFLLGVFAAVAAWAVFWLGQQMLRLPGPLSEEKVVHIAPGSSISRIAAELKEAGAIGIEWPFVFQARFFSGKGGLKAGEYQLTAAMSADEIIALLQSGKTHRRKITIPEGLMSVEIVSLLNETETLTGTIDAIPAEGSLLPETYDYGRGDTRVSLLDRMQKAMRAAQEQLWETRVEDLPISTKDEAVVLASIVEKETGISGERAKVAGVFANRLKIGMPLQSDPTVIYALTQGRSKLDRALLRQDLNIVSPYNTYRNRGLPPAPIANPGRAALEAVLNPGQHKYLYFVADGTGGHAFSSSLAEHTRNVGKWRKIQRERP